MTDRELLEAAARAAGLVVESIEENGTAWVFEDGAERDADGEPPIWAWRPLADDGDVARLEAARSINVAWGPSHVAASGIARGIVELYSDHGGDRNKARRYASTRAAAAMAERGE